MNKHAYNLQPFLEEDATSYYLLGAWMTDGCVHKSKDRPNRKTTTLTSKDRDWLEIINSRICPNKPILKHGVNCYRLMYNSTELADWLIAHKCTPNKSLTLCFPVIPHKYLFDFIRGCWDGDGSLSFTKSANKGKSYQCQANLTTGSLSFCKKLTAILQKHGIKCRIYAHGRKPRVIEGRKLSASKCWRVVLSGGGSVHRLVSLMYHDPNVMCMPRKQTIAQNIRVYRENFVLRAGM